MQLFAHYTATRNVKTLLINASKMPVLEGKVSTYIVSGKAEARKIAKAQGAEPWNF